MILVDNYFLAILCCVICCACWGSWANTQKMVAAKQWSFELFYWDLTVGLFLTALLGAVTLGSMGSEGRTFFEDLADEQHHETVDCCFYYIYSVDFSSRNLGNELPMDA